MKKQNQNQHHEVGAGKFDEFLMRAEDFFVDNIQKIVITIGGILVLMLLFFLVTGYFEGQQEEASMFLNDHLDNYSAVISSPDPDMSTLEAARKDLSAVIDKYNGSVTGEIATLYLGVVNLRDNEIESAEENFNVILNSGNAELKQMASVALSSMQINAEDFEQAAELFEQMANRSAGDQKRLFAFRSGELYSKSGNEAKARAMFQLTRSSKEDDFLFQNPAQQRLIDQYLETAKIQ